MGYGDLSCLGNPVLKTPNLDRLHAESIRLTDFHVAPMCTPTRGQLMSGIDCLRNGAMNVSSGRVFLRRELPTMADAFAAGGYRCGIFGKWHLGDNYPYRPHDRGFHEAIYYPSSHIGSAPDFWNNDYFDDTYWHRGGREKFEGYTTDVFFREAIAWIREQRAAQQPFFCYLPTAAAHGPLFVPQRYRELYEGRELPGAGSKRGAVARFFGMIANIDDNVGRLEAFLSDSGLRENTVLIFMTDNGGTAGVSVYNAGMKGSKVTLWEGGHRVPCFIRWPGDRLRAPGDVAELTEVQDLLPTLIDLCGLSMPDARFDGTSLAKLLRGETDELPERMLVVNYSRMDHPAPTKQGAAVLWKRWRLLECRELYDLATDPQQQQNVIDQYPEIATKMQAHLDAWWQQVAPGTTEFGAITIGADAENPSQLSPSDWQDSFFDQGRQVRSGLHRNGLWNVVVDRAGEYEFELRRWPREADAALAASLPATQLTDGELPPGVALPIAEARVKIGTFDERRPVAGEAKQAVFTARLPAGRTQLQTWFYDAGGNELCGAYYAYVRRK
jgi:arylsulfatase